MTFVETSRLLLRKVTEKDFSYFRADLADKEMESIENILWRNSNGI